MPLILTRKKGESVVMATGGIAMRITVAEIRGGQVRLAFDAPDIVEIFRSELSKRKEDVSKQDEMP